MKNITSGEIRKSNYNFSFTFFYETYQKLCEDFITESDPLKFNKKLGSFMSTFSYAILSQEQTDYFIMGIYDLNREIEEDKELDKSWNKIQHILSKRKNIIIEYGNSGDGDLYKLSNLQYIQQHFKYKIDIVTADGGFDFSIDFNKQEIYAIKLLYSQLVYALNIQKIGGTFIMKIFDIFSKGMIDMIYLLSTLYTDVNIYKPNTSRIANSEKYIICQNVQTC